MTRRITWLFAATFLLSGSILAAPPLAPDAVRPRLAADLR
jgi:hypothetical protein